MLKSLKLHARVSEFESDGSMFMSSSGDEPGALCKMLTMVPFRKWM